MTVYYKTDYTEKWTKKEYKGLTAAEERAVKVEYFQKWQAGEYIAIKFE